MFITEQTFILQDYFYLADEQIPTNSPGELFSTDNFQEAFY